MAAAVNSVAASHQYHQYHQYQYRYQYHQRFPPPLSRTQSYHLVPIPFSFSSSSSFSKTRKKSTCPLSITQRANKSKINQPFLVVSVAASENNNNNNNLNNLQDVIPSVLKSSNDSVDQQQEDLAAAAASAAVGGVGRAEQQDLTDNNNSSSRSSSSSSSSQVGGFSFESNGSGGSLIGDMGTAANTATAAAGLSSSSLSTSTSTSTSTSSSSSSSPSLFEGEDLDKNMADRAINAAIVLAAGTFAITKLLTIDSDYWHGWTLYEILRYAPLHNWTAYEEALKTNPVLAKMMISGVVYSVGDWIAQCYEGKPLFDFDRARMFRSGLVGFSLHGSLSHYYYYFCEALFPFQDWWVVPAKVLFDQTAWAAIWNSIYYVVLGFLRFESPVTIFGELKATFWPMLTAGWKLWPFAHLITYGVIPVEQRLLWVDCVELVWVTILSTYSNEKSEARHSEALSDSNTRSLEE